MNKNVSGRKFGRKRDQRKALLKSLAVALILREKIVTTEPKAKELRSFIEPMISRSRIDSVANRRLLAKKLSAEALKKLFAVVAPRYKETHGGYTRIVKALARKTDAAPMAIIELL